LFKKLIFNAYITPNQGKKEIRNELIKIVTSAAMMEGMAII
jgi:hypothetical protein